jgi:F0F1-type ATP synthase assembly protein I
VNSSPGDRSPLALAYGWAVRITTISLEMVLPGLIGLWIDSRLGTLRVFPVFLVLGMIVGVTGGTIHVVRLAISTQRDAPRDEDPSAKHRRQ